MDPARTKPWTCDICGKPITGDGVIEVTDRETGCYPQRGTSTAMKLTEDALAARRMDGRTTVAPFGLVAFNEMAPTPNSIAFHAYHGTCDPHPQAISYWFGVERAATLEAWCGWVDHLCKKSWMNTPDIELMIEFWFRNRGDDVRRHMG